MVGGQIKYLIENGADLMHVDQYKQVETDRTEKYHLHATSTLRLTLRLHAVFVGPDVHGIRKGVSSTPDHPRRTA
jgi:hypothetical protein